MTTPPPPETGAPRIASLVPSVTELVAVLGLASRLVARTGYCIHPFDALRGVPKVAPRRFVWNPACPSGERA